MTITPNADVDEYQPRTIERLIEILNAQSENPRSRQAEVRRRRHAAMHGLIRQGAQNLATVAGQNSDGYRARLFAFGAGAIFGGAGGKQIA